MSESSDFISNYLSDSWSPLAIGIVIVLLTVLFLQFKQYFRSKRKTILILGLNDAGKTVLFSKLINKNLDTQTYTSLAENVFEGYKNRSGEELVIVDFPGAERLRKQLFVKYFGKHFSTVRGILFVVDSSTFSKKARDVAEFLYDTLLESSTPVPCLVVCNKQDIQLAKSTQAISNALEKEMGLINGSRKAALETTDGGDKKRILTQTDKNFRWSDLTKFSIEFRRCCAISKVCDAESDEMKCCNAETVRDWLDHFGSAKHAKS